jgi:predicted HTH transcriptional regulator
MKTQTSPDESPTFENYSDFMKFLTKSGVEDVLVLKRDTFRDVTTPKRTEIIETIQQEEISSIRGLSRKLDRKVSAVHKDLEVLYESNVIDFRKENGSKIPEIRHQNILPEPLVYSD